MTFDKEYFSYSIKNKVYSKEKETHIFSFKSHICNQQYIVEVDLFENKHLAIIKFYLKNHSESDYKYSLTLDNGSSYNFLLILNTVYCIMLDYLNIYQNISFGFTGSPSINYLNQELKKKTEEQSLIEPNSQRFRIYRTYLSRYISHEKFTHIEYKNTSSYFIINKLNKHLTKEVIDVKLNEYMFSE